MDKIQALGRIIRESKTSFPGGPTTLGRAYAVLGINLMEAEAHARSIGALGYNGDEYDVERFRNAHIKNTFRTTKKGDD